MTVAPSAPGRKEARLAVRLTPEQNAVIREAAAATGQSLTDFVTSAALVRAEDALADRRVFRLDEKSWDEFLAILDRPGRPLPELVELFEEREPWDG